MLPLLAPGQVKKLAPAGKQLADCDKGKSVLAGRLKGKTKALDACFANVAALSKRLRCAGGACMAGRRTALLQGARQAGNLFLRAAQGGMAVHAVLNGGALRPCIPPRSLWTRSTFG